MIFWDGAELVSGMRLPLERCVETTSPQCSGENAINPGQGRVASGIQSIMFKAANGSELVLDGPFYKSDRLSFRDNRVYLERAGAHEALLASFPAAQEDNPLDLVVRASAPPLLRVFLGSR